MVPCLSGGAKIITSTHNSIGSSSPSSTLSESSNCPVTIPTRKPRTRRNRPNQKYNEAAALLSTAYPKLFSAKDLINFASPAENFFDDSSDLLLPFRAIDKSEFLLHPDVEPFTFQETERAVPQTGSKLSPNLSAESQTGFFVEDFDAESMLDEEIEEGIIDTIMGDFCVNKEESSEMNGNNWCSNNVSGFGFGPGLGRRSELNYGFGLHRGVGGALRNGGAMRSSNGNGMNRSNCWGFSTVDVEEISPKFKKPPLSNSAEKKKKKKKVEKPVVEAEQPEQSPFPIPSATLGNEPLLKLNYDGVLDAWSGRASPFADECSGLDAQGNDIYARLAEIDLFSEGGREACVLRYKEKRRTRLFCKKIRYQVRKDNADQRPRNKGRFVRRSGSNGKRLRDKNN